MNKTSMNPMKAALVKVALPAAALAGTLIGVGVATRTTSSSGTRAVKAAASQVDGAAQNTMDASPPSHQSGFADRTEVTVSMGADVPVGAVSSPLAGKSGRVARASGDLNLFSSAQPHRRGLLLGSLQYSATAHCASSPQGQMTCGGGQGGATCTTDSDCNTNAAPVASSVTASGTAAVGSSLSGTYSYSDNESNTQDTSAGGTSYRWVRSTDNSVGTSGDNTNITTGPTLGGAVNYTVVAGDAGKYLFYCVTPRATSGTITGTEICSPARQVSAAAASIGSVGVPANAYYKAGAALDFTFNFSGSVTVGIGGGTPYVPLSIGGVSKNASYVSGSGGTALLFRYTIVGGDNGVSNTSISSPLVLNGGTIIDGSSQSAVLSFTAPSLTGVNVDTTAPAKAGSGAITASDVDSSGSYSLNDTITLTFSEPILVANVTAANLSVSSKSLGTGAAVSAQSPSGGYATIYVLTLGTGTSVASGDTLTIAATNVVDQAANTASAAVNFTLPVFNTAPTASSVSLSGTTTAGNALTGSYSYSDADSDTQNTGGSGTSYRWVRSTDNSVATTGDNTAVSSGFTLGTSQTYTLVAGDVGKYLFYCVTPVATTGITTGAEACSAASSQVAAPAATSISSINSPSNGYYKAGTTLTFTVNLGAAVTVTGTPRIAVNLGGSTVYANYASGSGTSALSFSYTVQSGDTAASGISISSPVQLNGGTIQDAYSQTPTLTFTPPTLSGVLVDTTVPDKASSGAITANDADATGSYTVGDTLTLTFSEPVATASLAVGNLSVSGKSLGATPSLTPISASNGYATSYLLTLGSGTTVANSDTLAITAANVVDKAGNAAASVVNFTLPTLNAVPVASTLGITGTAQVGVQLTGTYTYSDAESNPEGTSQYAWYVGANSNGSGKTAINLATGINYTPVAGDVGKYLFFCVTPVASAGTATGVQACSAASSAVLAAAINGQCGTVAATPFMPSGAGLCLTPGAASAVNVGSPWTWTCQGSYGGSSSPTCSAPNSSVTGTTTGRATQSVSNGWVIDTPNSAGFIPVSGHAKSPLVAPPAGYTFPQGLFDVTLTGPQGGSTTLVLTFSSPLPAGTVYMKYGKTSPTDTAHWYRFTAAQIGTNTITLPLVDGGQGDDDGTLDGVITDPGGPAIDNSLNSVPTLSEWATLGLSGGLAWLAMLGLRRRRQSRAIH